MGHGELLFLVVDCAAGNGNSSSTLMGVEEEELKSFFSLMTQAEGSPWLAGLGNLTYM